MKTNTIQ